MNKTTFGFLPFIVFSALLPSCVSPSLPGPESVSSSDTNSIGDPDRCNQWEVIPNTMGEMIAADWCENYPVKYHAKWNTWNQNGKNRAPMAFTGDLHPNDACWVERFFGKFGDSYAVTIFDHETEYPIAPGLDGVIVTPESTEKPKPSENQTIWGVEDRYCLTYSGAIPLIYRNHEFFTMQEAVDFSLITIEQAFGIMDADVHWLAIDATPLSFPCEGAPKKRGGYSSMLWEEAEPLMLSDWRDRYGVDFSDSETEIKTVQVYESVIGWLSLWGVFVLITPPKADMLTTPKDYFWPVVPTELCTVETGAYASPTSYLPVLYNFYSRTFLYPDFPLTSFYNDCDYPAATMRLTMPSVLGNHLKFGSTTEE